MPTPLSPEQRAALLAAAEFGIEELNTALSMTDKHRPPSTEGEIRNIEVRTLISLAEEAIAILSHYPWEV